MTPAQLMEDARRARLDRKIRIVLDSYRDNLISARLALDLIEAFIEVG